MPYGSKSINIRKSGSRKNKIILNGNGGQAVEESQKKIVVLNKAATPTKCVILSGGGAATEVEGSPYCSTFPAYLICYSVEVLRLRWLRSAQDDGFTLTETRWRCFQLNTYFFANTLLRMINTFSAL